MDIFTYEINEHLINTKQKPKHFLVLTRLNIEVFPDYRLTKTTPKLSFRFSVILRKWNLGIFHATNGQCAVYTDLLTVTSDGRCFCHSVAGL